MLRCNCFRMLCLFSAVIAALLSPVAPALAGPNDLVLVITNEDYRGGVPKVEFARRDGEAFMKAMRELAGVPASRIIHIGGPSGASRGDFFDYFGGDSRRLADLAAAIRPDTNLYLFYSGHGLAGTNPATGEPALFLVPVDGDTASPADRGNALPDIEAALSGALAKRGSSGRVFLFLDTCFGGTSAGGAVAKDTRMVGDVVENVKAKPAPRVVRFAAATGNQLARWDPVEKHGLFTDALIEALYALQNTDQKAPTAGQLQAMIYAQVERRLAELFPGQPLLQTPTLLGDEGATALNFSATGEVRDPARQRLEATRCKTLAHSEESAEILAFLASCRSCTSACRTQLRGRALTVERELLSCRAERSELERLTRRGAPAKAAIAQLASSAECAAVRSEAAAALAQLNPPPVSEAPKVQGYSKSQDDIDASPAWDRSWSHNGSVMRISVDGTSFRIIYLQPRSGMLEEGVRDGTVLFEGEITGRSIRGTAYLFSRVCGRIPYPVNGSISENARRIALAGAAPRLSTTCRRMGTRPDELQFVAD